MYLSARTWIVTHYLVALAVVISLRVIKSVPLHSLPDVGWAMMAAALLSALTGAGVMVPSKVFRGRPKFLLISRVASLVLLLLVSALMIIQAE